jgi:hypothetical protein
MKIHIHLGMSEPDDVLIDFKEIGCSFTETSREIDLEISNTELYGEVPDFEEFIKTLNASFVTRSMNTPDAVEVIYDLNGNELWSAPVNY